MPPGMTPAFEPSTSPWLSGPMSRSQMASPTPEDTQVNGTRVTSPVPDSREEKHAKKRLSLGFLTKGVMSNDGDKENEHRGDKRHADDAASIATSTRSRSKEISRNRLSLSFLGHAPSSPPPEALPNFSTNLPNNSWQGPVTRTPSYKRPETSMSARSDKSLMSRADSMKKRLSSLTMSKQGLKNSVRGRFKDTVVEE